MLRCAVLVACPLWAVASAQEPTAEVDPALGAALVQLADPERAPRAMRMLVAAGEDAVPVLAGAYRDWAAGTPVAPLWSLLWVTGRIGAPAAPLWERVAEVFDASVAAHEHAFASQAAWALGELVTPANADAIGTRLRSRGVGAARFQNNEVAITLVRASLELDGGWADRFAGHDPRIDPLAAGVAIRCREGRGREPYAGYLVDAWRRHRDVLVHVAPESPFQHDLHRSAADVALTLLLRGERSGVVEPGELALVAVRHFDPTLRAQALERAASLGLDSPAALKAFVAGLADAEPEVSAHAIRGLNAADPDDSTRTLIAAWLAIAERDAPRRDAAAAQARALARMAGDAESALVAFVQGATDASALAAQLTATPGFGREVLARWTAVAGPIRWQGWTERAAALADSVPARRPELWPALVDRVGIVATDAVPAALERIERLADAWPELPHDAAAARLEAAVAARIEPIDLAPVFGTLARLRIPAATSTPTLLGIVASGDSHSRLRAVELLVERGERSPAALEALRAAVEAEHPVSIQLGRRAQIDTAGRIAVQDAAERALAVLQR